MFGIKRSDNTILCRYLKNGSDTGLMAFYREEQAIIPVLKPESEIDNFLQEMINLFMNHSLTVFKLTDIQEEQFLIKRLRGY